MNHITDDLYKMQGERLSGKDLAVPCETCGQYTPWDKVTWVMGEYVNRPYCDLHIEEALTKGKW